MRQFLVADVEKLDYFLQERLGRRSRYGEGETCQRAHLTRPSTFA
jgi:hypothetical protein